MWARHLMQRSSNHFERRGRWSTIILLSCFVLGCSGDRLSSKIVFGTVKCGGEPVADGHVRFVPIEGTPGPASTGIIADGQYRIEARGGVPTGKHRVEVLARKKTGRKVRGTRLVMEGSVEDETVLLGPEQYEGEQSPLVLEVTADSDGHLDIEIPRNPTGPRPEMRATR